MLEVSRSGYYAWKNRGISKREQRRQVLLRAIVELHKKHFHTRSQAQNAIFEYIEAFYNTVRPHSGIGWHTPVEFERLLRNSFAA